MRTSATYDEKWHCIGSYWKCVFYFRVGIVHFYDFLLNHVKAEYLSHYERKFLLPLLSLSKALFTHLKSSLKLNFSNHISHLSTKAKFPLLTTLWKSPNSQTFPNFSNPHPQPKLHGSHDLNSNFVHFFSTKCPNYLTGLFPIETFFCGFPTTLHKLNKFANLLQVENGKNQFPTIFQIVWESWIKCECDLSVWTIHNVICESQPYTICMILVSTIANVICESQPYTICMTLVSTIANVICESEPYTICMTLVSTIANVICESQP